MLALHTLCTLLSRLHYPLKIVVLSRSDTFVIRSIADSCEVHDQPLEATRMSNLSHLLPRADPNRGCTLETCEPSQSVYGYRANLAATVFFLILFFLSTITYMAQGLYLRRTAWFFAAAMCLGGLSETLGYVAKMLLWNDPFSDTGFKMSVVLLTFAPAFYAAGVYYTLKHICLTFSPELSRLKPKYYTWIFISCDSLAIILQAVGGAISSATDSMTILDVGTNVMIAGLAFQVFTLCVFGLLAADYGLSCYRHRDRLNPSTTTLRNSLRFRLFLAALWLAYFGILIRCAYRVAELVQGWVNNPILRDEGLFIGLDSVACGVAAVVLNIFHPGWCFPKETKRSARQVEKKLGNESSSDEGTQQV